MTRTAQPFSAAAPDAAIPSGLEAIVFKCLEKQPGQRYPSMEALIADLRVFEVNSPIGAMSGEFHTLTAHPAVRTWDWSKLNTGMLIGGVLAILVALLGLAALTVIKLTPVQQTVAPRAPIAPRAVAVPVEVAPAQPAQETATPAERKPAAKVVAPRKPRAPKRATPRTEKPVKKAVKTPRAKAREPRRPPTDSRDPWAE
jgi:hypothetical protein